MLPAYENLTGRFQDAHGKCVYDYIDDRVLDIQNRLHCLFLVSERSMKAKRES